MPTGDLSVKEQKESYRHIEEMSQRFLRLIIATLALGFVFARPEWVEYMTSASPPSPGLRAYRKEGYIGQLSSTIVLNNGSILKALVVLGVFSLIISILLAALILFLREPTEVFSNQQKAALGYNVLQIRSRTLLRRAYIAAFNGVLFLILAAGGFWAFYIVGGQNILLFDIAIVMVGVVSLSILSVKLWNSASLIVMKDVDSPTRVAELCIYCMSGVVAIFFYRYVFVNAMKGLIVWMKLTGFL